MAKLLKLRRGTTTQHASFTGAEGEVTIDTTKDTAVVHDGSQAGGRPLAREDMSNVSSASIAGRLGTDSIATSKIAAGTLPSDVVVTTNNISDGTIVNADIAANAAIAGSKLENSGVTAGSYGSSSAIPIVTVDAQGLVTAASTTAIDSTTIANGTSNVAVANNGNITATRSGTARLVVDDAGVDVTGTLDVTGTTTTSKVTLNSTSPTIEFEESDGNPDFRIVSESGVLYFQDADAGPATRLQIGSTGDVDVAGNFNVGNGVDVTGNITVTGTVDGVDVAAFKTAFDNAFPSGTKMLFQQTSAPTGWTKVTSGVNNKALRVVSGTAGSGGSNAFTTAFASRGITANAANTTQGGNVSVSVGNSTAGGNVSVANATQGGNVSVSIANASTGGTVNNHTLSTSQMPSHSHSYYNFNDDNKGFGWNNNSLQLNNAKANYNTGNTGGGGSHNHGFTGGSHSHNANASYSGSAHSHNANFSGTAHNHNANGSFSGSAHNHSISVTNLDMEVQYLDVIIATKN